MGAYHDRVIANYCVSFRFALRTLRAHGLRPLELHLVTRMTTVSSLMDSSPASGPSPMRQGGHDLNARWRVSAWLNFFHQILLHVHLMNLLVMLRLACSGLSLLIRTTFSDITLMKRNLQATICVRGHTVSLSLLKTPELCFSNPLWTFVEKRLN